MPSLSEDSLHRGMQPGQQDKMAHWKAIKEELSKRMLGDFDVEGEQKTEIIEAAVDKPEAGGTVDKKAAGVVKPGIEATRATDHGEKWMKFLADNSHARTDENAAQFVRPDDIQLEAPPHISMMEDVVDAAIINNDRQDRLVETDVEINGNDAVEEGAIKAEATAITDKKIDTGVVQEVVPASHKEGAGLTVPEPVAVDAKANQSGAVPAATEVADVAPTIPEKEKIVVAPEAGLPGLLAGLQGMLARSIAGGRLLRSEQRQATAMFRQLMIYIQNEKELTTYIKTPLGESQWRDLTEKLRQSAFRHMPEIQQIIKFNQSGAELVAEPVDLMEAVNDVEEDGGQEVVVDDGLTQEEAPEERLLDTDGAIKEKTPLEMMRLDNRAIDLTAKLAGDVEGVQPEQVDQGAGSIDKLPTNIPVAEVQTEGNGSVGSNPVPVGAEINGKAHGSDEVATQFDLKKDAVSEVAKFEPLLDTEAPHYNPSNKEDEYEPTPLVLVQDDGKLEKLVDEHGIDSDAAMLEHFAGPVAAMPSQDLRPAEPDQAKASEKTLDEAGPAEAEPNELKLDTIASTTAKPVERITAGESVKIHQAPASVEAPEAVKTVETTPAIAAPLPEVATSEAVGVGTGRLASVDGLTAPAPVVASPINVVPPVTEATVPSEMFFDKDTKPNTSNKAPSLLGHLKGFMTRHKGGEIDASHVAQFAKGVNDLRAAHVEKTGTDDLDQLVVSDDPDQDMKILGQ